MNPSILKHTASGEFSGLAWSVAVGVDSESDLILKAALSNAVDKHLRAATRPPVRVEHRADANVGVLTDMAVDDDGLRVTGKFDLGSAAGRDAFARVRSGDLTGLSIGFDGNSSQYGPIRIFDSIDLAEVSVCKNPINSGSRVHAIKSWRDVESVRDLEKLLHGVGLPNRLAARVAKAGWFAIEDDKRMRPEVEKALQRILSV
jgi:HK97 family phage prohead protease